MKKFFSKLFEKIKSIFKFSKENEKKIDELGLKIVSTIDIALPIVQTLANFGGINNLDKVISEIRKWNTTAGNILNDPEGNLTGGIKLGLASTQLRNTLVELLKKHPTGVKFGNVVLKSVDEVYAIPDNELRVIVEFAYSIFKASQK